MIDWIRFFLTAICMLAGLVVCCISVYGIFRFEYAANRMHAAAMLDTMGVALCMGGIAISAPDFFSALKCLLVIIFWWLSSPVASHMLCRLEMTTDEQRGEYMTVHTKTLAQEREEALQLVDDRADALQEEILGAEDVTAEKEERA